MKDHRVTPPRVDVVLPCLNEERALPTVLGSLPENFRAVVVDNGSTDASARVATELGATLVTEPRRGYGAAVQAGLEASDADIVCFIDADGSLDLAELPLLVTAVTGDEADLAVGSRVPASPGIWPWHARAGNMLLSALLRRRGLPVHDIAPARACRRGQLLRLGVADRGLGYPLEMLIRAAAAGWRVREFDVAYYQRAHGTVSKVSGSMRGTMRAVRDMSRVLRT